MISSSEKTKQIEISPAIKGYLPQVVLNKSLNIVAELGIADLLADSDMPIAQLAEQTNSNSNALLRTIRLLTAHGIFELHSNGNVSNTPFSEALRSDVPGSQRNFLRMMGSNWMWDIFNQMDETVKSGGSALKKAFPEAENLFQYFKEINPQGGKIFSQSMSSMSANLDTAVAASYDYSVFDTLIDIGGAEGNLLKEIKQISPNINAVLFDLPHVIEQVKKGTNAALLQFEAGSFFDGIKTAANGILIKYVLHNWDDAACIEILKHCKNSLTKGGKLLIAEMLIDNAKPQIFEKSMDVTMMLLMGSPERTQAEFSTLLEKAGFQLTKVIPTGTQLFIIEAEVV